MMSENSEVLQQCHRSGVDYIGTRCLKVFRRDSSTPGRLSLHLAAAAAFADSSIHILYGPRRGDASTILIRIPRGTRQVPLLFDAVDMPRNATVAMELRREDGKVLARCNVKLA